MLTTDKDEDIKLMHNYYRASDMLDFLYFFPEASKLERLAICFDDEDYINNKEYFDSFDSFRIDSPKDHSLIEGIESDGLKTDVIQLFKKVKDKNKHGVILFFDLEGKPNKRYTYDAGISVNVNLYDDVCIEAVSKGFDGREISKGVCVHERYLIPWFDLRGLTIDSFHKYRIYKISQEDYYETRKNRINFLNNLGEKTSDFISYIPSVYEEVPDYI